MKDSHYWKPHFVQLYWDYTNENFERASDKQNYSLDLEDFEITEHDEDYKLQDESQKWRNLLQEFVAELYDVIENFEDESFPVSSKKLQTSDYKLSGLKPCFDPTSDTKMFR